MTMDYKILAVTLKELIVDNKDRDLGKIIVISADDPAFKKYLLQSDNLPDKTSPMVG